MTNAEEDMLYYECPGCNTSHDIGVYAMVQMIMGHSMKHRCPCGMTNELANNELIHSERRQPDA